MIDIVSACDSVLIKGNQNRPRYANRSSDIGDDCERKLVYERTRWKDKKPVDLGLLYVFAMGSRLEDPVVRQMQDGGVKIIRQQEPFEHKSNGEVLLSGHIDGIIDDPEGQAILEIKTMNEHIWEATNSAADFARYHWTRKYPPQLNAYCFGLEIPRGVWVLVNKSNGRLKQISWELDFSMAEQTLQRCERINRHVKDGTLPDCIPNTPEAADYCEGCPFFEICKPPINRDSLQLIVDKTLIDMIEEMFSLESYSKRFSQLKDDLKDVKLSGIKNAVIGTYFYDGKKRVWMDRWTKS